MARFLSFLFASVLALPAPPALPAEPRPLPGHAVSRTIEVGGMERTFLLHVPPALPRAKPAPLVLIFHGGGATAAGTERMSRFSALADREGFLVAYPEGVGHNWNDGREFTLSRAHRENIDDVKFVAEMIDAINKDRAVDPKRVYATGISNGGIFAHYLAANLSGRIAAIAPVVGGLARPFDRKFKPEKPVSVLIIQGTSDPLVPYQGGEVGRGRGSIIPTEEAAKKWAVHDGCDPKLATGTLPDRDPDDGCTVKWSTWSKGRDGAEVTLYRVEGGGHTWPGGPQYLPARFIGKVCRDFDASEAIWEFFKKHPKP